MDQNQILQLLMTQGNQPQQSPGQRLQAMYQNNPASFLGNPALMNSMYQNQQKPQGQQQQQGQQPSWLDSLSMMMMMGGMGGMGGQSQQPQYSMGGGMMGGQQKDPNWWQKGLQATGSTLQGIAPIAGNLAAGSLASGAGAPATPYLAGGALAAGGLGSLFQYLGQPGQHQPTYQGGWA